MQGILISPKEETQRLTEGLRKETLIFPTGGGGSHGNEISSLEKQLPQGSPGNGNPAKRSERAEINMTRRSSRGKETAALEDATAWNSFKTGGRRQGLEKSQAPGRGGAGPLD